MTKREMVEAMLSGKTVPKKRPMTRDEILHFVATTPGIVIKINKGGTTVLPGMFSFTSKDPYFWSKSSPTGDYDWHPFEAEVCDD